MNQILKFSWRSSRTSIRVLLLSVLFACAGCQLAISVSSEDATSSSPVELINGRTLYKDNCAKCHDLFEPNEYSFNEWHAAVRAYGPRAKLDREECKAVLNYLIWALEHEQDLVSPIQTDVTP